MPIAPRDFKLVYEAVTLNPAEKKYILDFQFHMGGGFYLSLMQTIARADQSNREALRRGFPEEVAAYESWIQGNLAERARALGVQGL